MALGSIFRTDPTREAAGNLYRTLVVQSRTPEFYTSGGVPDSLDGRFDLVALHVALVIARLKRAEPALNDLAQALFDEMVANLDVGLREAGVGDMGVGRRMKKLVSAFYGRAQAYDQALDQAENGALVEALKRNVFRAGAPEGDAIARMVRYVRSQFDHLHTQRGEVICLGRINFLPFTP